MAEIEGKGEAPRRPHAVLDLPSRQWKAMKIEQLLGLSERSGPLRMLEVGTGSGGIAHYFGNHDSGRFEVDAVDVVDNRLVSEGYSFATVDSVRLPYPDDSFDVVLSNHVIEHVGDDTQQRLHLAELRRVLKPGGAGYLAVPNRWMLVEPHYKLAFLSWLPESMRSAYLRLAGKGEFYDCRPLTASRARGLLAEAGFNARQQAANALMLTFELEQPDSWLFNSVLKRVPRLVYRWLEPAFPTLIYVLGDADHANSR